LTSFLLYIYNFICEFNIHNKYSKEIRLLDRGEFLLGPSGTYEIDLGLELSLRVRHASGRLLYILCECILNRIWFLKWVAMVDKSEDKSWLLLLVDITMMNDEDSGVKWINKYQEVGISISIVLKFDWFRASVNNLVPAIHDSH
jgi:hypothetical protein